jgi:hypothetical protein
MERYGKLSELDRSFDIAFWQAQGDEAIVEAAHQLILDYCLLRGMNAEQLRLQRSVEAFQRA